MADHWYGLGGNNSTGDGSEMAHYADLEHVKPLMAAGDTAICKNGTYSNDRDNLVCDWEDSGHALFTNGTSTSNRTTIRAEDPYQVRLVIERGTLNLDYFEVPLRMGPSAQYVHIDGFICVLNGHNDPGEVLRIAGDHNYASRCLVRRNDVGGGSVVNVAGTYGLLERVGACGVSRYTFKSGGTTSTARFNVMRQCVGRMDGANTDLPKATFFHYGNNGAPSDWEDYASYTNHLAFQNCIAIDGVQPSAQGSNDGSVIGIITSGKWCGYDLHEGNIILNCEGEYGFNWLDGRYHTVKNNAYWGLTRGALGNDNGGYALYGRSTLGDHDPISNITAGNYPLSPTTHNAEINLGSNNNFDPTDLDYLVRRNAGSSDGAQILYAEGELGKHWGETGWTGGTQVGLWPWANQDAIRDFFKEDSPHTSGHTPTPNVTTRGFCAVGETLTKSIWEALGNAEPQDYYSGSPPPPQGSSVAVRFLRVG